MAHRGPGWLTCSFGRKMVLPVIRYTVAGWMMRLWRKAVPVAADGGQQRSKWDDPRVPWAGKPRRVDILCWAGITLSGIYYWALLPFRASLLGTHPVLSELLNGSTEAIVAAAAFARVGHGSLVVALLAAIPGLMMFDPLYWWAGRLWGERVIALLSGRRNRGAKYMARVQRWGRKFTWPAVVISPFLPIPNAIIFVIAGWAGMRLLTFIILDIIGSLLWAGMLVGLGYELGHHAVVVAQTVSHYGLWISIALIAVIVVVQVRSQRHMMRTVSAQQRRRGPRRQPGPPVRPARARARGRYAAGSIRADLARVHLAPLVQGVVRSLDRLDCVPPAAGNRARTVRGLVGDGGQQQSRGHPADLLQAHVDAGQRGLGAERHRLPVVEADQRDVARYAPPGRAERVGHAAGDLVAAAEDRVDVRLVGEQQAGRLPAPALAPLAVPHAAVRHQRPPPRARRRTPPRACAPPGTAPAR